MVPTRLGKRDRGSTGISTDSHVPQGAMGGSALGQHNAAELEDRHCIVSV